MDKAKRYIIIYQKETDGEICIEYCEFHKLRDLLEKYHLHIRDIAIIDGTIIKDFGQD